MSVLPVKAWAGMDFNGILEEYFINKESNFGKSVQPLRHIQLPGKQGRLSQQSNCPGDTHSRWTNWFTAVNIEHPKRKA